MLRGQKQLFRDLAPMLACRGSTPCLTLASEAFCKVLLLSKYDDDLDGYSIYNCCALLVQGLVTMVGVKIAYPWWHSALPASCFRSKHVSYTTALNLFTASESRAQAVACSITMQYSQALQRSLCCSAGLAVET
jgi:hypothetical protein